MTPSNPSNSQPLIYRIMDALGVSHLVACINHTHEQSEVDGLVSALAGKLAKLTSFTTGNFVKVKSDGTLEDSGKSASDFQTPLTFDSTPTAGSIHPVTSGGVKSALDEKADENHTHTVIGDADASVIAGDGEVEIEGESLRLHIHDSEGGTQMQITPANAPNLYRALQTPDSAPTASSDKLVTSGGVKAALDVKAEKADVLPIIVNYQSSSDKVNLETLFADGHSQSTFFLENYTSVDLLISDFFATNNDVYLPSNAQPVHPESVVICRVVKDTPSQSVTNYFVIVEAVYQ